MSLRRGEGVTGADEGERLTDADDWRSQSISAVPDLDEADDWGRSRCIEVIRRREVVVKEGKEGPWWWPCGGEQPKATESEISKITQVNILRLQTKETFTSNVRKEYDYCH
jgi:hypothetical protein